MKIFIICSTSMKKQRDELAEFLKKQSYTNVLTTWYDDNIKECGSISRIINLNHAGIEDADIIYIYYDGESYGAYADFCVARSMGKPVIIKEVNGDNLRCQSIREYCIEEEKDANN
jgi:hypothetical protein